MLKQKIEKTGFAAFYIIILVMAVASGLSATIFALSLDSYKASESSVTSLQSFYVSEAGLEDALLRLKEKMPIPSSYSLQLGGETATITVSDVLGGARTISSEGDVRNRVRKNSLIYEISSGGASFFYGAQIGQGGLVMDNNSKIVGNVFSNGSILANSENQITGTVKVAQNGNRIDGANVLGDIFAHTCEDSIASGTLHSVVNDGCQASDFVALDTEIASISLPITDQNITDWKEQALQGGTLIGDYNLEGSSVAYLGPKKIQGNLTIQGSAQLYLTGTIWATGNVQVKNSARVRLDGASYGSFSGMIISDGLIDLDNNSTSSGSGSAGSYLMYLSTANLNPALIIQNNATADILYASRGWIEIRNNAALREITGYGVHTKNNVVVTYEVGLQNPSFVSGPAGSWEVRDWRETQ